MESVFDPVALGNATLEVMRAAQLPRERLAELQAQRLQRVLAAAVERCTWWRERLHGVDLSDVTLERLPRSTKGDLMAHFADWVADPALRLDELRRFTTDRRRIGDPYLGRYVVWESSGTRGEPAIFVQDAQCMAVYDALEALRRPSPRPLQRLLDPMCIGERIAFVGATTGHFASAVSALRLRRVNRWLANSMRSFCVMQPTAELVDELNRFQPTIVVTYPTAAALLAEEALRGRLKARPREVWTGGEQLSAPVRRHIAETFECSVSNSYGASEFLPIGWECRHGHMHANTDWVLIEPVDARGRAAAPGAFSHTTLLTNLVNTVQPVIRYDLGDRIRLHAEPCRCGSPFPVIEVEGRCDDPLHLRGQDGGLVTLLPLALTTLLEDDAHVFEFQLEQRDATTLVLRLAAAGAEAQAQATRCRAVFDALERRQGLAPVRLVVEPGRVASHGRSGKVRRIVAAAVPPDPEAAPASPLAHPSR